MCKKKLDLTFPSLLCTAGALNIVCRSGQQNIRKTQSYYRVSKGGQDGESSWGKSVGGTFAWPGNSDLLLLVSPLWCSVDIKKMDRHSLFHRNNLKSKRKIAFYYYYSGEILDFIGEMYILGCKYESIQSYLFTTRQRHIYA